MRATNASTNLSLALCIPTASSPTITPAKVSSIWGRTTTHHTSRHPMTSPDHQIVTFDLFGVSYLYKGSTRSVDIISGSEIVPIKSELDNGLRNITTTHIPSSEQIFNAFMWIGFKASDIPEIKYTKDQPEDNIPPGAIS